MKLTFSFLLTPWLMITSLTAQDLTDHRWENRLLLILTTDEQGDLYQAQLAALRTEPAGLNERKLLVYQLRPGASRTGLSSEPWRPSDLYQRYQRGAQPFTVLLIGLDGTEKLRQHRLLTTEQLFNTIDAMPMRRREMRQEK
jgi:hypothetical protein